ncbi:MAG: GNAT family N-acetyltransferase, partial [Methyloligellaceae bacterium]
MGQACHVATMTQAHLPAVAGLCGELGYVVSREILETRFERLAGVAGHAVFIALDAQDRVIGFLHVFARPMLEDTQAAQVQAMVVHVANRRQGVGALLLAAGEAWARTQDCERMVLYSADARSDAHAFYTKCGYGDAGVSQRFVKSLGSDEGSA